MALEELHITGFLTCDMYSRIRHIPGEMSSSLAYDEVYNMSSARLFLRNINTTRINKSVG
jgi:hypothetical protein